MSQSTPSRNDASSEQYRTCQTPNYLRKSPRFHPQSNNLILITPEVEPKRANKLDSWKIHFDFGSISPNPIQRSFLEGNRKGCLTKCSKVTPLRSIENLDGSLKNVSFGCADELSHVGKAIRRSSRISGKKNVDGEKSKKIGKESVGRRSGERQSLQSIMEKENVGEKLNFSEDECKKEKRRSARLDRKDNTKSEDSCKSSGCKNKKPRGKQNVNANEQNEKTLKAFERKTEIRRSQRLMYSKTLVECTENVKRRGGARLGLIERITQNEKLNFSEDGCKKEERRSARLNRKDNTKSDDSCKSSGCKNKKPRGKQNVNVNEQNEKTLKVFECKTETRRSQRLMYSKTLEEYNENVSTDEKDAENDNVDSDLSVSKDKNVSGVLTDKLKKNMGVEESKKRKGGIICRGEISSENKEGQHCGLKEWSEEQNFMLQKAYLIANPSPHFWKKVARMVPGKSAQECFDRVNGSLITPPPQQSRPRANKTYSISPIGGFSLSDGKPTSHPNTTVRKVSSKKKSLVAQKTVRHLLRKHSKDDQNQETDYFSLLQTSPVQLAMSSPEANSAMFSPKGISSSSHNKRLSRFSKSNEPSPVVLKKVKNVALHERYIDQLHNREVRRKYDARSSRVVKREIDDDKSAVVKAAKNALIAEATDVIIQFKQSRVNLEDVDDDDDIDGGDEEEEDDE